MLKDQYNIISELYNKAKIQKDLIITQLDDIQRFIMPNKASFFASTPSSSGKIPNRQIYHDGSIRAASKFVSNIQYALFPTASGWAKIQCFDGKSIETNVSEAFQWCFNYLQICGFESALSESLYDLILGTGILQMVRTGNPNIPFVFKSCPYTQTYLTSSTQDGVGDIFREQVFSILSAKSYIENMTSDKNAVMRYEAYIKKLKLHAKDEIFLIEGVLFNGFERKNNKKYKYVVSVKTKMDFQNQSNIYTFNNDNVIYFDDIDFNPFIPFFWSKLPGEYYGKGVGHDILTTCKAANELHKCLIIGVGLSAASPIMISNAVGSGSLKRMSDDGKLNPGAIYHVASTGNGIPSIVPINTGSSPQIGFGMMQDYQNSINEGLYTDQLGSINDPVRTAEELRLREQEASKRKGASIGRLNRELVIPLIAKTFYLLFEYNAQFRESFGFSSVKIDEYNNLKIDDKNYYISAIQPVDNIQKTNQLQGLTTFIQTAAQIIPVQILIDAIGPHELIENLKDASSLDNIIFKDGWQDVIDQDIKASADNIRSNLAVNNNQNNQQLSES